MELELDRSLVVFGEEGSAKRTIVWRAAYLRARISTHGAHLVHVSAAHWDFLPKFLSLHYYTTLEGVLGVQRRGQAQGTIICLFGPLFFSQNGMTFKKATKIIKIH